LWAMINREEVERVMGGLGGEGCSKALLRTTELLYMASKPEEMASIWVGEGRSLRMGGKERP